MRKIRNIRIKNLSNCHFTAHARTHERARLRKNDEIKFAAHQFFAFDADKLTIYLFASTWFAHDFVADFSTHRFVFSWQKLHEIVLHIEDGIHMQKTSTRKLKKNANKNVWAR